MNYDPERLKHEKTIVPENQLRFDYTSVHLRKKVSNEQRIDKKSWLNSLVDQ